MGRRWYDPNPTPREIEIIKCIASDLTNKEIAQTLYITTGTVKAHIRNIIRRTGCQSRLGITIYSLKQGWITLDECSLKNTPAVNHKNQVYNHVYT